MDENPSSFGYWLRRRRKALDLTQEQLARQVSCSRFTIRKIEADERRPSRHLVERLASKLAIAPQERAAFLAAARSVRAAEHLAVDREPRPLPVSNPGGDPTPFVGRRNEYGLLLALLARLTAGAGHAVLVAGEPGIGKSRLLRELADYARRQALRTLSTRCYEIERAVPYQPVIELVTQAVELASPAVLNTLAPVSLAELAALVPELGERIAVPALSSDFPAARQARLFRAIVQLFDALAAGHQLVVGVDDIQWADDASVQFLHWLARQAAQRPLLVLYAFRDEEVHGDERLAGLVASLRTEAHVRHVALAPLGLSDTEALLAGLGDAALAQRVHRETEGNPFFLSAIVQALREGQAGVGGAGRLPLPEALRRFVRERLAHVPPTARSALDVAAVLGRQFEFDVLVEATGEPEARVLQALEQLTARRVLREQAAEGVYDFSHDKLREVAYLEIGAARRILLHRAVAEALERSGEGDARLAEHYERGHAWAQALACMVQAGERSMQLFAMRDALHWFDRAVALAEARPEALQGASLVDLVDRRGAARAQAGHTEGAVADIRRVIEHARERGDRARTRDALIRLGMTCRRADDHAQAVAALDEALRECRASGDERRAADTLYHLGTVAWSDGRNREAIAFHEQAVAICERLGLADLAAVQAWHGRGEAHFNDLQPHAAIACYERSIELARGIGDRSYECENLMMVAYACTGTMGLADYPRAEATFERALDIARHADLQWHVGPTMLGLDHVRGCTGRYGQAWTGMSKTLQWLQGLHLSRYQLMAHDLMGLLLMELGLNRQALELLERALAMAAEARIRFWQHRIQANAAIASMRLGRLDVGPLLESAHEEAREHREAMQMVRCLEALAELAWARGDPHACLAHAGRLLEAAEAGGLAEWAAVARRWRGEALAAQGDRRAAVGELTLAETEATRLGRVRLALDAALALARLGQAAAAARARLLARRIEDSLEGSGLHAALALPA